MELKMLTIKPIPAFNDNYIWSISNNNQAVVVDPGCAQSVSDYLDQHQLNLTAILITHHHADHTGGITELVDRFRCSVFGGNQSQVAGISQFIAEGEEICLLNGRLKLKLMKVSGHTLDHVAFFNNEYLFCGDTLFSAGCGRLFEGTAEQMFVSLKKISQLPASTLVFPTHEYTLANIEFALTVEPQNKALNDYAIKVRELRQNNIPSLPTSIALEKNVNPFLRAHEPSIQNKLVLLGKLTNEELDEPTADLKTFSELRRLKDNF
jgi:hydroxyacylglutathione hydrolase